jgi:hypothetical protein
VLTTNLDFARWVEVFGDATLTGALLDRLTHHAHILLFQGESYRFRESRRRKEATDSPTPSPERERFTAALGSPAQSDLDEPIANS